MPIFPCRSDRPDHNAPTGEGSARHGFSLMEVMVTLAIISIVVSMATVSLSNSLESARFASLSKAAANEVQNFRAKALLLGQNAIIATDTSTLPIAVIDNVWRLPLPEGWSTEGDAIALTPSGMCLGGQILMINPKGRQVMYDFAPPKCTPKRVVIAAKNTELP